MTCKREQRTNNLHLKIISRRITLVGLTSQYLSDTFHACTFTEIHEKTLPFRSLLALLGARSKQYIPV